MATLAELKAKLLDWSGADTSRLPDSVQTDLVNMAQRELIRQFDLRFGESTMTLTTVIGQAAYSFPTRFSRPLKGWYIDATGATVNMDNISREDYVTKVPDYQAPASGTTAPPTAYAIWGGQIFLSPVPDSVLTIYIDGYALLADLSAPTDHNDFTDYAWEVLLWKALTLSTQYLIEDPRQAVWQDNFEKAKVQLLIEHARSRSGGRRPVSQMPG